MARKSILVVDDEKSQREILEMILSGEGYDVTTASSGEAALKFAKDRRFDLALTDLKMTGMDGIELLQHLLAQDSSIIVILLTAHGSIDSAKDALRRGAFDYLQKPYDRDTLLQTIRRALKRLDALDAEIVSASSEMEAVKKMILKVARSTSTVLIRGESGTGKELIARAIHNQSPRVTEMFQAVNCAAINENLYYRINVLSVDVPPLRERHEDIPVLIDYFLKKHTRNTSRLVRGLTPETRRLLMSYSWPGNVRQLESAIERAILLCEGDLITVDDLPLEVRQEARPQAEGAFKLPPEGISFEDVERGLIVQAMEQTDYNITKAAKLLGLTFRTLQYRLEKFGIKRPDAKSKEENGKAEGGRRKDESVGEI